MRNLLLLSFFTLLLSACDGAVTDFVTMDSHPSVPVINSNGAIHLKVSPGSQRSAGATYSMKSTVTPTGQILKSGQMSATLTMHSQRVSP